MKGACLILAAATVSSTNAEKFTIGIPKKSWAIRGYESFNSPESDLKAARAAAKPKKERTVVKKEEPKKAVPKLVEPEGASIPNEVFNLVKAIVGVGVLSLPAGVATFGSAPSAFIPAAILITVIGILSGYGFSLIGRVCAYTGAKSYREAWSKTVGEGSSWIPAWSTTCKTFLACLAFSMVLADTFSSLLETGRNQTLLTVTTMILVPLCLMKNLKSLAPFSLIGVMGMAFTAFAMTVRWLDGSYSMAGEEPGALAAQLAKHLKPRFGKVGIEGVFSPNSLILVCMLSTAYMVCIIARLLLLENMMTFDGSSTLTAIIFLTFCVIDSRLISMLPSSTSNFVITLLNVTMPSYLGVSGFQFSSWASSQWWDFLPLENLAMVLYSTTTRVATFGWDSLALL